MGLEISISKKGLMKVGIVSSIIIFLVFAGFLVVNLIIPSLASTYSTQSNISVVLSSPANYSYLGNSSSSFVSGAPFRNINFTFTPTWNSSYVPKNVTLYGNFTGSWAANRTNSTPLNTAGNATLWGINISVPSDGAYIWNVMIFNASGDDINDTGNTTGNWTVFVDTTAPIFNTTTPATGSYISGNVSQLFQVYVYDKYLNTSNVTLHYEQENGGSPSTWTTGVSLTCYAQASPLYICNRTVDDLNEPLGGPIFWFYFDGSDSATNYGNIGTASSPLITTIDRTAPTNTSASIEKIASGTKYDTTGTVNYGFQMSWTDSGSGMSIVLFESNFTGGGTSLASTTASNTSSAYYVNFSINNFKQAGTYAYKWYATDSVMPSGANNSIASGTFYYTINKADNVLDLYLNDTKNANISDLSYPNKINATAVVTAGDAVLWRNVSGVWTDKTSAENKVNMSLPVGVHTYKVNTTGNANYTANNSASSYYVTIGRGVTAVTLYLNSSSSNTTIASGDAVNVTAVASNSEGSTGVYNGTVIGSETSGASTSYITAWSGPSGREWNITGYYNQTQNYTDGASTSYYIKIETTSPTYTQNYSNVTASVWGKYQGIIGVNAKWNDNFNLSNSWLSNKTGTGSWINSTATGFGTNDVTNFTINVAGIDLTSGDVTFQAKIYANDTSGNENVTNTWQWTIDGTVPVLSSPSPSNNTPINGNSSYPFKVTVTDYTLNTSNATVYWKRSDIGTWSSSKMVCTGTLPDFTCLNNSIDLSIYGNGNTIYFYFEASDNSSLMGRSASVANPYVVTIDRTAPQYSNNGANVSVVGKYDSVLIYANWTNIYDLGFAWLETNDGGTAVNYTNYTARTYGSPFDINLTAGETWSNFTWANSTVSPGTTVTWKIFANDSAGNVNATSAGTFSIDNTKPTWSSNISNVTNSTTIAKGTVINLTAVWNDNYRLGKYWLSSNETNSWVNGTLTSFTSANQSDTTITTSTATVGKTFQAKIYANDTSGNENYTYTFQWTIDNTIPTPQATDSNVTNDTTIARNTPISLSANWTDNIGLSYYWIRTNATGTWSNTSVAAFSSTDNSNSSAVITASAAVGSIIQAYFFANDTSGNENYTDTWQWTIDGTAPTYSDIRSSNSSLTNATESPYAPGMNYYFNISLSDNINVSTVLFEWTAASNQTATAVSRNSTGGKFSFTKTDLGVSAANYTFKWYVNDTSNNWVATSLYTFNVTQNTSTASFVGLAINGTEANATYYYPQAINATAWRNISEVGNLSLWRNNAIVQSTTTDASVSNRVVLGNGEYNYTLTFTPTNYTSTSITADRYAIINKGPTNITLWIGQLGSVAQANATLPSGSTLNITATVNTSYNVWLNITTDLNISTGWFNVSTSGTTITNTTSTSIFTVNDNYNITAHFDGDGNFTASSRTFWLNITSDVTGPIVKLWDDVSGRYDFNNTTAVRPSTRININASASDEGVGIGSGYICNVTLVNSSGTNFIVDTITYSGTTSSGWCNKTVTIPSVADGYYTLNVSINDTNNRWNSNNTYLLVIDSTAPLLTISSPSNASYNKLAGRVWINGSIISDNLQMGMGNISVNDTRFAVYNFTGANATTFAIWNTSGVSDGYVAIRINYTDNATNIGNATVYFYEDNTAPSAVNGLKNSTAGTYQPSSSQVVQVLITDNVQTNQSITLNYWTPYGSTLTALMTGTPGTTTTYSTTIDTSNLTSDGQWVKYYITGVDNASNSISSTLGGSTASPLGNITISNYCGNNGTALSKCIGPLGYYQIWETLNLGDATTVNSWTSLSGNRTTPKVLESIQGKYSYVYYWNNTQWLSYSTLLPWSQNDLKYMNQTYGNGIYNINMTAIGTLKIS